MLEWKWISIKDKPAPIDEDLILFNGEDVFCGHIYLNKNNEILAGMQGCHGICYGWYDGKKVTHWMPLPKPPEEE